MMRSQNSRGRGRVWIGVMLLAVVLVAVPLPTQGQPRGAKGGDAPAFRPPGLAQANAGIRRSHLLPCVGLSSDRQGRTRRLRSYVTRTRQPGTRTLDINKVYVIDGDTFAYGNERIRIRGIDTPELSESGGVEAADRLRSLFQEGPVTMVSGPTDDYGRTLAEVFVNRRSVAQILTAEGYAKSGGR